MQLGFKLGHIHPGDKLSCFDPVFLRHGHLGIPTGQFRCDFNPLCLDPPIGKADVIWHRRFDRVLRPKCTGTIGSQNDDNEDQPFLAHDRQSIKVTPEA